MGQVVMLHAAHMYVMKLNLQLEQVQSKVLPLANREEPYESASHFVAVS